ncbi:hypothetical protein [Deinococcus pimensis]|uniref:hypothetical protein n=1 Tax=Deinococcus pimensis TaxID=309888 RepID=UPI0004879FC0|nr:hypothetical protein [Deinococcus pimensis]
MSARRTTPAVLVVLALTLLMGGCASSRPSDAARALQEAVAGTLDRQADTRERLPERLRRATTWRTKVPVEARELRVTYDTDLRAVSWRADVTASEEAPQRLLDAEGLRRLGTVGAREVDAVEGGPFDGAFLVREGESFAVMTRAYVLRYEPDLLKFAR